MNFIKKYLFHESAPNRSSRPLNTQLPLEISIRIQWKTSQKKLKSPKIIIISLTPIPLRGQLCMKYFSTRVWKNFSSFITESDLPECADRSVQSSEAPTHEFYYFFLVGQNQISNTVEQNIKNEQKQAQHKNPI